MPLYFLHRSSVKYGIHKIRMQSARECLLKIRDDFCSASQRQFEQEIQRLIIVFPWLNLIFQIMLL